MNKALVLFCVIAGFLFLAGCTGSKFPSAPSTSPSISLSSLPAPRASPWSALGRAYGGGAAYASERPDLIVSRDNLVVEPSQLTFLPGETSKQVTVTVRDDFIWKDAFILKGFRSQAGYTPVSFELNGNLNKEVADAGLRWIMDQSSTTLTISRSDLNTADPYRNAILIFAHTQPGGGAPVTVQGEPRDVWLTGVVYFRTFDDGDDAQSACQHTWIGAGGQNNCCGDDPGERYLTGSDGTSSCCRTPTDCVNNRACVSSGQGIDTDGNQKNDKMCMSGQLADCDRDQQACVGCDASFAFIRNGEKAGMGGYAAADADGCCGDDASEHRVVGKDGTSACCSQPFPFTTVTGGKCLMLKAPTVPLTTAAAGISFAQASPVVVSKGTPVQLTPVLRRADGSVEANPSKFVWKTNRPDIIIVGPDGSVTGPRAGTAEITVSAEGYEALMQVMVQG